MVIISVSSPSFDCSGKFLQIIRERKNNRFNERFKFSRAIYQITYQYFLHLIAFYQLHPHHLSLHRDI